MKEDAEKERIWKVAIVKCVTIVLLLIVLLMTQRCPSIEENQRRTKPYLDDEIIPNINDTNDDHIQDAGMI